MIIYREAAPADRTDLRSAMREILIETGARKAAEFDAELWAWEYEAGERGSFVVLALDGERICGYYHVLLVPVRSRGEVALAAMVQDVAVMPSYRGRGVFRGLGAYALQGMRDRHVEVAYTFPNRRSEPSFVRDHSYRVVATIPVRAAILSVTALVRQRLLRPDAVLAVRPPREAHSDGVRAVSLEDPGVVADVAAEFCDRTDVHLVRSASYLRWRFTAKPRGGYTTWGLRDGGRLVAYVVTLRTVLFGVLCLVLMDLGCRDGADDALVELIRARLTAERQAGAAAAVTMIAHPFVGRLRDVGFMRVPEVANPRPFRLLTKPIGETAAADAGPHASWTITPADWDVL